MANEIAGKKAVVYVLAGSTPMTGSTGAKLNGMTAAGLKQMADMLESTQLGSDFKTRIFGLKDTDISASGNLIASDTAQAAVETAYTNGTAIMVGVYFQGTSVAGYQVECLVQEIDKSAQASGLVTFNPKFVANGAVAALPARS